MSFSKSILTMKTFTVHFAHTYLPPPVWKNNENIKFQYVKWELPIKFPCVSPLFIIFWGRRWGYFPRGWWGGGGIIVVIGVQCMVIQSSSLVLCMYEMVCKVPYRRPINQLSSLVEIWGSENKMDVIHTGRQESVKMKEQDMKKLK